jgi:phosphoglycolate phosphatase
MLRLVECIEAVAFDLDGTLIDTAPDLAAAANMMLSLLGGRPLPEDCIPALIGDGVESFVARVLEKSRGRSTLDPAVRATASALFARLYEQHPFERSRIFPGVVAALEVLGNAGLPLWCVTNKESRFALPLLEAAGLREFFAVTVCADRPEDRKPSPNMLLAACRRLGVEPANLLYVGDSLADIAAARAANCRVVAVTYGYSDCDVLAGASPDGLLDNLTTLTSIRLRRITGPQDPVAARSPLRGDCGI